MNTAMKLLNIIDKNMTNVNIFNYNEKIRKTTTEFLKEVGTYNETNRNNYTEALGKILYRRCYDIFEESLRDENNWNNYFKRILKSLQPVIVEINNNDKGLQIKEPEIPIKRGD